MRNQTIKRDKTDILFSELIRERADWHCEYCKKSFQHDHHSLHCSHLFGRRAKSVRWHPQNASAHCQNCHKHLGENPVIHSEWSREKLGNMAYDTLRVISNKPMKWKSWEKEFLHKHFLSERKRMKKLRESGEVGYMEFTLP